MIIIKEDDKCYGIVVQGREDFLAEARTQLEDRDVYQELKGNTESPTEKIIKRVLRKVRNGINLSDETSDFFWLATQSLGDFIFTSLKGSKIYQGLYNKKNFF